MRLIMITINDNGHLEVREGAKYCGGLAWDEMLGQIAAMTMPTERITSTGGIYPMKTYDEWDEQRRQIQQITNQQEKTA